MPRRKRYSPVAVIFWLMVFWPIGLLMLLDNNRLLREYEDEQRKAGSDGPVSGGQDRRG